MVIRVLHVIDHMGLGGGQVSTKGIVENMDKQQFETFVCALRTKQQTTPIDAKVISLKYGRFDGRTILAIAKLCKKQEIDILHAQLSKSIITCLLVSFFCKLPIIVHERGAIFRKGIEFSIYRFLLRILHHKASVIIANSQATANELTGRVGIKKDKIEIIYNAIDFHLIENTKTAQGQAKKNLGISEEDVVIGFVGRLHEVKGVDLLIKAFAILLQESPHYLLVLAGEGPQRQVLERLTEELGIAERVKFLGMCKNIYEVVSAYDIGIIPSRQEPFGRIAVEFMRMKVPIVSSGVDGLAELVSDGNTGLVPNENSPEQIASAIESLLNNKQLREELIGNAYSFSEQFSIDKHVAKLQSIYLKVLGK